jgi:hypothetical protein
MCLCDIDAAEAFYYDMKRLHEEAVRATNNERRVALSFWAESDRVEEERSSSWMSAISETVVGSGSLRARVSTWPSP